VRRLGRRREDLVRLVDAESLTQSNLMYREPLLYDQLLGDDPIASELKAVIRQHCTNARTVLDLGCGTARLLAELDARGMTGTGIDLQPSLIAWAQHTHPRLRLSVVDLRTARLGTTFDVVTCVGNTLSYLHTETELTATFNTISAHSNPGTLLALATLTGTGQNTHSDSEITTSLGTATVTTTSEWDPDTQIQTTTRTWRFATGRVERDTMRRRYWSTELLGKLAHAARFHVLPGATTSLSLCAIRRQ
jgi:SAM-dependent methyltransferase